MNAEHLITDTSSYFLLLPHLILNGRPGKSFLGKFARKSWLSGGSSKRRGYPAEFWYQGFMF